MVAIDSRNWGMQVRWAACCQERGLPFRRVDVFASDLFAQVDGCRALLWHPSHLEARDMLLARTLALALAQRQIVVYPNHSSVWHFDDKVAQKYLFEALGVQAVHTTVLYEREAAMQWAASAHYPKVFKLRRGAASQNVWLVRSRREAEGLIRRAFGAGFKPVGGVLRDTQTRVRKKKTLGAVLAAARQLPGNVAANAWRNVSLGRDAGYAYFQDFIPGNDYDTRVTVIGDRAFGFTRNVRPGDFRASGSGSIDYDIGRVDPRCVTTAFDVTTRLGAQSLCFDFLHGPDGCPLLCETSCLFVSSAIYHCPGHWRRDLEWVPGPVHAEDTILDVVLREVAGSAPIGVGAAR